jgi:hypothetical protein
MICSAMVRRDGRYIAGGLVRRVVVVASVGARLHLSLGLRLLEGI